MKSVYIEQKKAFDLGDNITYIPTLQQLQDARLKAFMNHFETLSLESQSIILSFNLWERIDDVLRDLVIYFLRVQYFKDKADLESKL